MAERIAQRDSDIVLLAGSESLATLMAAVKAKAGRSMADHQRFLGELFAPFGPVGCEITGIALTPDGRTMFVNIQHPGEPQGGRWAGRDVSPQRPAPRPQFPTLRLLPFCFGGYFCSVAMCRPSRSMTSLYSQVFCWVIVARGPGAWS
jgi:hypothetical protein